MAAVCREGGGMGQERCKRCFMGREGIYGSRRHKEVAWIKKDVGKVTEVYKRCNASQVGCAGGMLQVWKGGLECLKVYKSCCSAWAWAMLLGPNMGQGGSMGIHNRCSSGHGSHIGPAQVKKDAWGCIRGAVKVVCVQYMGVAWSERCVMVHRSFIYF